MSSKITNIAQTFLNELHSAEKEGVFGTMKTLLAELENKSDPDPTEIRLVTQLYHFVENFEILKNNVRSYSKDLVERDSSGNKLSSLWENQSYDGMHKSLKL